MINPYVELFQAPGTRAFVIAGMLARMPISMTGIGLITMLSQVHDGYGLASSVAAVFALSTAFFAPQVSRLVDRYSQGRVLPMAAMIGGVALLLLLLCTRLQAPIWTLFLFASLSGCMPSMSAMVRARWAELYKGNIKLQTAFSLESVLDEASFIIGPPISVGLSLGLFPEAGPLMAALLLAVGVTAFVLQRVSEPPVHPLHDHHRFWQIASPAVLILVVLLLAMGVIVGVVEVVSVAFSQNQGQPEASSVVLSVFSIGSLLAGLAFGTLKMKVPLPRQLLCCGVATALTTLPLLLVTNTSGLAVAVFISGLFFSPTLIVSMALVEKIVSPSHLTEGLTWLITGLSIGVAIGAASSGWIIDHFSETTGFWVSLVAGAVVLGSAMLGYRRLGSLA